MGAFKGKKLQHFISALNTDIKGFIFLLNITQLHQPLLMQLRSLLDLNSTHSLYKTCGTAAFIDSMIKCSFHFKVCLSWRILKYLFCNVLNLRRCKCCSRGFAYTWGENLINIGKNAATQDITKRRHGIQNLFFVYFSSCNLHFFVIKMCFFFSVATHRKSVFPNWTR